MTFDEFYGEYRKHDGEYPQRRPTGKFNSYNMVFANGDTYTYMEMLKPGSHRDFNGNYSRDDFDYVSAWNGSTIKN